MSSDTAQTLLAAIGLMLVFEGIGPFVAPKFWRRTLLNAASLQNQQVRALGCVLMVAGVLLLLLR